MRSAVLSRQFRFRQKTDVYHLPSAAKVIFLPRIRGRQISRLRVFDLVEAIRSPESF